MKVIIGQSVYEMGRNEYRGILRIASKQVPFGIYAVEKHGVCELEKQKFDNKEKLKEVVAEYIKKGFNVHYNVNN